MKISSTSVPFTRMFKKLTSSTCSQSYLSSLAVVFMALLLPLLTTAITIPDHNLYYYIVKPTFAVVEVGPNQTINQNLAVRFNGITIIHNHHSHLWKQTDPNVDESNSTVTSLLFTGPLNMPTDINLKFKLVSEDTRLKPHVHVAYSAPAPPNKPPIANAGIDQTVNAGSTVRLDGTKSGTPDGSIKSYSWMQTSGPFVRLNGTNLPSPTFTAPSVSSDTILKFSLTVRDDRGAASINPATMSVTVKALQSPSGISNITQPTISPPTTTPPACYNDNYKSSTNSY